MKRVKVGIVGLVVVALFLGIALTGVLAQQEKYPTRPVTIICPWKPGGAAEIAARIMAKYLEPILGQRVDVVCKTGGTGATGTTFVKNSKADGYTLIQAFIGPFAQVPLYLGDKCPYDPLKDFYPLGQYSDEPVVMLAKKEKPWDTIKDFIMDAKNHPGKYKCGAGGSLSLHAIFASELFRKAGVDVKIVPYPGCLAGVPDLLGGDLDIISGNYTGLALYPDLKALGVFANKRDPLMPSVPTIKELGYDVEAVSTWAGYAVRSETPDYIKEKLVTAIRKVATSKEFKDEMWKKIKVRVVYRNPVEFYKLWEDSLRVMEGPVKRLIEAQKKK